MQSLSPAQALWNRRQLLAQHAEEFRQLVRAVHEISQDRVPDMSLPQWASILAFTLDYQPDLVIELGRDFGNSTCCFLEAAAHLRNACQLVSLCRSGMWFNKTAPALEAHRSQEWFARGTILQSDFAAIDLKPYLAGARRVLIFWDAHGFDVAEYVLAYLLPQLADRPHVVLAHDMTDLRYHQAPRDYGPAAQWRACNGGDGSDESYLWLGHICSRVAQVISITDFTARNGIAFHSADHDLHTQLGSSPQMLSELRSLLGELFAMEAHWFWFSPNEASDALSFPRLTCRIPRLQQTPETRIRKAWRRFLGRKRAALPE